MKSPVSVLVHLRTSQVLLPRVAGTFRISTFTLLAAPLSQHPLRHQNSGSLSLEDSKLTRSTSTRQLLVRDGFACPPLKPLMGVSSPGFLLDTRMYLRRGR